MSIWRKLLEVSEFEEEFFDGDTIASSGLVFSNFVDAQSGPGGFILLGNVIFNPCEVKLSEGTGEFFLNKARILVECSGCGVEVDSLAYLRTGDTEVPFTLKDVASETTGNSKKNAIAGRAFLGKIAGIGGKLEGTHSTVLSKEQGKIREEDFSGESTKHLVFAFPKSSRDGLVTEFEWRVFSDPRQRIDTSIGPVSALVGISIRDDEYEEGLARIVSLESEATFEIRIKVVPSDVVWTSLELDPGHPLYRHRGRLLSGRKKKDFVGRLGLSKIVEGSTVLQKFSFGEIDRG